MSVHNKCPPLSTQVASYLLVNTLLLAAAGAFFGMLVGTFKFPKTVGLYAALPYYTYTLGFRRLEVQDGGHWIYFSRNAFFLKLLRKFLQMNIAQPLPNELVEADKKPGAQFVIATFPHAVFADYRAMLDGMLHHVFPNTAENIRTLGATFLFRIPIVRELGLWTGCVDASRAVAERLLDKGRSILVVPGGEAEQIRTTRGREILYLKHRKGFVSLAMSRGVPLVPLYVFGASDYYYTSHALFGLRDWIRKKTGVCIMYSMGLWGSPLCPLPIKTTFVFGKPMVFECKVKGAPTRDEVDIAHQEFCVALQKLFDDNKEAAGFGERVLEMV